MANALCGRSGGTLDGVTPLSPMVIESWARLKDIRIQPHEVDALFLLDSLMRNPEHGSDGEE